MGRPASVLPTVQRRAALLLLLATAVCTESRSSRVTGTCGAREVAPILLQRGAHVRSASRLGSEIYCEVAQKFPRSRVTERDQFLEDFCAAFGSGRPLAHVDHPVRRRGDVASPGALLARLQEKYGTSDLEAVEGFKALIDFEAEDLFAFQETWSEADTQILRSLDPRNGSFVDDELTSDSIRRQLPSVKELEALIKRRSLAIVGSGSSLEGKGLASEIEAHAEVARFNDFPTDSADLGSRTTVHVTNRWTRAAANVTVIDLELWNSFDPYCFRLSKGGMWYSPGSTPWMIRPTARCSLPWSCREFTRGFLFYWLVGTLFDEPDLYGFTGGAGHIDRGQLAAGTTVQEPFLLFEHKVLAEIRDMQKEKRVLAFAQASS